MKIELKKKIAAGLATALTFISGLLALIWNINKRKEAETKLGENKKALEAELNKQRKYAEYKKENEKLVQDVTSGDFDASIKLLQDIAERGQRRNSL